MSDIKNFYEIAMEKIAAIGDASEEEKLGWKYVPEGEKLAASCLNSNKEIENEIKKYDNQTRPFILQGARKVLIANIGLPKNDISKKNTRKAMDSLLFISEDKDTVTAVFDKINYIFEHYNTQGKQQKDQTYKLLEKEFQDKVNQALAQQTGTANNVKVNVETLPQFKEEWNKVLMQIENQYANYLNEYKKELAEIK